MGIEEDILYGDNDEPVEWGNVEAPDLSDFVIGYRAWSGVNVTGILGHWVPGVNTAKCASGHHAPAPPDTTECLGCGLYAYHSYTKITNISYGPIWAAIRAWGDMYTTFNGFRAEYAEIIALTRRRLKHKDVVSGEMYKLHQKETTEEDEDGEVEVIDLTSANLMDVDILQKLSDVYDVPIIGWDRLQEYAENFGKPIPKNMRPGLARPSKYSVGKKVTKSSGNILKNKNIDIEKILKEKYYEIPMHYDSANLEPITFIAALIGIAIFLYAVIRVFLM